MRFQFSLEPRFKAVQSGDGTVSILSAAVIAQQSHHLDNLNGRPPLEQRYVRTWPSGQVDGNSWPALDSTGVSSPRGRLLLEESSTDDAVDGRIVASVAQRNVLPNTERHGAIIVVGHRCTGHRFASKPVTAVPYDGIEPKTRFAGPVLCSAAMSGLVAKPGGCLLPNRGP